MPNTTFLLLTTVATSLTLTCGCATTGRPVHLPALTIEPEETDRAFESRVREAADVEPDGQMVCIIRFDASLAGEEAEALGRRAVILKGSRRDTWFVLASMSIITGLLDDERVLWIAEYENRYKLGRRADTIGTERRWVHVVSFAGNHPEFRAALTDMGVTDIRYDSVLDQYTIYINGDQCDRLITFWWVREVYKAGGRGLYRTMCW